MKKYIAYYRVSTRKQGDSGLGLDAQRRMVLGYVRNDVIINEFTETETGTSKRDRPILSEAIRLCRETGATLLIAKLDRLARDVHFISSLSKAGVDFVCCDNPNANKLTINLLASVAESEAEAISSRTRAGLSSIKKRIERDGVYVSRSGRRITSLGTPSNLTRESALKGGEITRVKFENNRNTRMARPYAKELRARGLELSEIAERLNDSGFVTATGKRFNLYSVHRLVKNE